jgi:uncharacterized damage-inducible protein DinB
MKYESEFVAANLVPQSTEAIFQHIVDTYASETNKTAAIWMQFSQSDLSWKPDTKSASVQQIMQHEILSERRFFADFLGRTEPQVSTLLPEERTVVTLTKRFVQLATPRLAWLASLNHDQWLESCPFFEERRERIWIFWRRVLHSAHHRTQLTVYLRLLEKPLPPTYGPTADVTWEGATPTLTT